MADKSEDIEFLQEQVQRLNTVLSQYQNKCQHPGSQDEQAVPLSPHGPHASWLTDKTLLTPLLTEYDNVITQLQQNITTYQTELLSLNTRVEQVTAENARLYQQLRESLETQMVNEGREGADKQGRMGRNTTHTALQNQLTAISKDRDEYREKWRQAAFELEHLQKSGRERNRNLERYKADLATAQHKALSFQQKVEELQTACVTLNEQYNQCMETAQAGEQMVEELTQALSDTRSECKALQIKNTQLLRAHSELTQQLRRRETEMVLDDQEQRIDGRVHLLELSNTELEARLIAALNEIAVLTKEKAELEGSVVMQRSRLAGLEREVHEAVAHVKESMEMVESAILDKDQAVIVSQQQTQEAERLRTAMDTLLQEAGHRTRKEVDAVRAEYNRNIDKMAEEIQKLEEECGEKQAMIERAEREKKATEKELESVRERASVETAKAGETIQQLQNRVHEAERVRQEACRKMNAAATAQRASEASLAEEKRHYKEVCSELERRVREKEEEGRRVIEDRARLAGELQEMMDQLTTETQAREAAERRAKQEVAAVSQHYELREREFQYRLQAREQTHNKSTEELRELLTSQYRMGTRWREESKNLTQKFEETINSLRNEVTGYRRKNEALKVKTDTLTKDKEQLSQQLQRLQSSQSQLQRQLRDTDTRAEAAATQVSALLLKEKQLLAERRELQRQLDKLKLEIAHRAGIAMAIPGLSAPPTPGCLLSIPTIHPSSAPLDAPGWEQAISGLHQSIRQVRRELEETHVQIDHTQAFDDALKRPLSGYMTKNDGGSPDSSVVSEHSALHREDLSSNSHLSNTLPA